MFDLGGWVRRVISWLKSRELINLVNSQSMHVRISPNGRKVLNNRDLAYQVVETVINQKSKLDNGETVPVQGNSKATVQFVTTIPDKKEECKR